ncbi:hypothetical protein OSB04_000147 [Centaurea solstitialis]|uniref:AP2/ERF domain-containing protein n=1 Tax=Centaurea solstitialis TaxID=347529 RepID=A0AA38U172_9ASTR|nr:hypothetical protein OSB04_000147 [Centaurea solstitialis]
MKSIINNNNGNNDNNDNNKNSNNNNWLGFSLSPHMNTSSTNSTMVGGSPPSDAAANTQPSSSNPTTYFSLPSHFNYQNIYCSGVEGENGSGLYSNNFPIMPLKSDGSLCLMEAITRSQSQGMVSSTPPKLENFFGGVTMGTPDFDRGGGATMALGLDTSTTMYYNQNPDHHETLQHNHRHQIQPQHYQDYSGFRDLYQTVQQQQQDHEEQQQQVKEAQNNNIGSDSCNNNNLHHHLPSIGEDDDITGMKNWISRNYHQSGVVGDHGGGGYGGDLQSLSLSMSFGCSQSQQQHQQMIPSPANNVTDHCVVLDSKKRGCEKVEQQQKQIVHRKSLDTFGQRTSQYRGVTRHRWTGRYEAHLWDNSCKKEGQSRKGRQGGYDMEEKAARAYDLAALKYWGPATHINFPLENYEQEVVEMKNMSRQEYVAHLRRQFFKLPFTPSTWSLASPNRACGREQGSLFGHIHSHTNLEMSGTQEEAAEAYDVAAIKFRGINAVTNFDISRYNVEKIIASNTLLAGELARRTKEVEPSNDLLSDQITHNGDHQPNTATAATAAATTATATTNMLDWKMALYDQNGTNGTGLDQGDHDQSTKLRTHLSNSSSLVTSLSSSREESPERNNNLPMILGTPPSSASKFLGNSNSNSSGTWIPTGTTQLRPHIPVFAAWTDA